MPPLPRFTEAMQWGRRGAGEKHGAWTGGMGDAKGVRGGGAGGNAGGVWNPKVYQKNGPNRYFFYFPTFPTLKPGGPAEGG